MSIVAEEVLPTALDCRKKSADRESEKASDYMRAKQAADTEKKALLDKLSKPSGVSEEERMRRAASIINRAVNNGLSEVEVARFPNKLFNDMGRAINQQEAGWENTLTGLPKELYEFWDKHLKPRGYRLKYQIADWPDGIPGDISITLTWADRGP